MKETKLQQTAIACPRQATPPYEYLINYKSFYMMLLHLNPSL